LKRAAVKNGPPYALTSAPVRLGLFAFSSLVALRPSAGATA
jgi:hypothetical protein